MGQPSRVLPPLTSSTLPDVSRAFTRGAPPSPSSTPAVSTQPRAAPTPMIAEAVIPTAPPVSFQRGRYTLGQLVESVRQRKQQTRLAVESGDIDGPELDLPWIGGVR